MMGDRNTSHSNHVPSRLMRESLVDKDLIAAVQSPVVRILPDLNVVQIGGKIMDRGREALLPLLNEIVENQAKHTQVIAVGAGIRSRHLFAVGLDLGLPTGALATLSAKDAAQNAYMVSCLLAKHGFVYLEAPFIVQLLPAMLAAARGAVFNGVPPYDLWEHPPEIGRIPPHRTDSGAYMIAEVFGARRMIFLKDVDGLYSCDPALNGRTAEFIPRISVSALLALKLSTLPLDPIVLELMRNAKLVNEIQIINGLKPGTLTRALAGEPVGSTIYSD
jgi:molybdenum storage protein